MAPFTVSHAPVPIKKSPQGEQEVVDRDVLDILQSIEIKLSVLVSHLTLITEDRITESDIDIGE